MDHAELGIDGNRLILTLITGQRTVGNLTDIKNIQRLWSASSEAEALGLAVQQARDELPGYSLATSTHAEDITDRVREWVSANPPETDT